MLIREIVVEECAKQESEVRKATTLMRSRGVKEVGNDR